jgi:ATP-dependent Zn protease
MPVDLKHIAYHEAGHAVIGLVVGYDVRSVTIKPKYGALGKTSVQPGAASSNRCVDRDAAAIKIGLAGPLAEQLISPVRFDELLTNGCRHDWRNVKRIARDLNTPREAEILIVMLAIETATLVQQHRQSIVSVATALLERETLTGEEIARLTNGGAS